jgi:type I restriction enzyme S subunit
MKKYDSYKDSGVEWIGDIPNHWHVKRLKNIGSLYSGLSGKSGSDFEKVPTENFKPFINFTNIANNKYILGDNFGFVKINENENQNQVRKNDLFFLMSSENQEDVGKSALLLNDYDELYLNSFCKGFRLTINSDARFINYLLTSSALSQLISLEGRGFTRINLRMEGVENLPIILPQSIEEQTAISNFLDHKTTQIDQLIAKKEQFIQLLEEERVAVINQAVTKGLDPNVAMKDSGIDWLGKIPKHWDVKIIKHTTYVKGRIGWKGLRSDEFLEFSDSYVVTGTDFHNGTIKWETCYQVPIDRYEDDPFIKLQNDDLLITKDGTIGKIAIVKDMPKIATLNSGVFLTRPLENEYYQEFMYWILYSEVFKSFYDFNKSGSTIQHLYQNVFNEFKYPLPPIKEQIEIVNHVNKKTDELDLVISKTKQEIALLKEYKTALISEVVTGKVDVSTSSTQVLGTKN